MITEFDFRSVRCRARRDGVAVFTAAEPAPSNVVHLFQPRHPDYEAAGEMHRARLAEQAYRTAGRGEPI